MYMDLRAAHLISASSKSSVLVIMRHDHSTRRFFSKNHIDCYWSIRFYSMIRPRMCSKMPVSCCILGWHHTFNYSLYYSCGSAQLIRLFEVGILKHFELEAARIEN